MKKNKFNLVKLLRLNYREILIVFLAFALMVAAAYFSVGVIVRERLLDRAEEMIFVAEANVRAGLSEAETILLNTYNIVEDMMKRDASVHEILEYLIKTTEWMRQRDLGLLSYYGVYGFINGEFYDGIGLNPGSDYIPQTRPWYQTAIRSGSVIGYTTPYIDWRTDDTVISAVKNFFDEDGRIIGILTLDFEITWLVRYVISLSASSGGYGILVNQNMTILAHPDHSFVGLQFQELGGDYINISRILRGGGRLLAHRTTDNSGKTAIVFFTRIVNGWYVGIVIPYYQFYKDVYYTALILIILGLVLSLALCYILLRLSAAKMRSDEKSESKSSFLASMSHEIRTPMNAITGMTELILRSELTDEVRGYAQDIKQAGNNLISIINDILDISKIEAGKLEIIPSKFIFSSLINDTVNIVRIKIGTKPLRFFTNIDCNIPSGLFGDEVRLRQMLLNLLTNAVKYSDKGYVGLFITIEKSDAKQVWLKFVVTDTGKGIRSEDQEKLFGEFIQVDTANNRGIEGTGLGLSITKKLCNAMGGTISVESEYGKGSSFTMCIPLGVDSRAPFAAIENSVVKKVLVYEGRYIYAKSISWSLENMCVPHIIVTNTNDFIAALRREEWFYVFSGYGLYDRIKPIFDQNNFYGGKKPPLALMVEKGTEAFIPNIHFVSLPIQSLSIANVLNGNFDSKDYTDSSGVIRYTYPTARLLIVDDLKTNLNVAEGLLSPYRALVETCLSGAQAIELAKRNNYDIVFMDHMMPDMDGIEAVAHIREWEEEQRAKNNEQKSMNKESANERVSSDAINRKRISIVALTANSVVGMREMFLEKGFDDFLAKPIDISKLDKILERNISPEKREKRKKTKIIDEESLVQKEQINLKIYGVDTKKGITRMGNKIESYISVLNMFCVDAEERLPLFQKAPDAGSLSLFTTQVHAIKSAAASIGAEEVSKKALELEEAGRNSNYSFIEENLNEFAEDLKELLDNIHEAKRSYNENISKLSNNDTSSNIRKTIHELKESLASKQASSDIFIILDELNKMPLEAKVRQKFEKISFHVLMSEYEEAINLIDESKMDV